MAHILRVSAWIEKLIIKENQSIQEETQLGL